MHQIKTTPGLDQQEVATGQQDFQDGLHQKNARHSIWCATSLTPVRGAFSLPKLALSFLPEVQVHLLLGPKA